MLEFHASSDYDIDTFWDVIRQVDETLTWNGTTTKLLLPKKKLQGFFGSLCKLRHYMFSEMNCAGTFPKLWMNSFLIARVSNCEDIF